ncbi:Serine protease HTRA3 [Bienertia sinuspersici]
MACLKNLKPLIFVFILLCMASDLVSGQWCTLRGYPCGTNLDPCCDGLVCVRAIARCCTNTFIPNCFR